VQSGQVDLHRVGGRLPGEAVTASADGDRDPDAAGVL
jgi:hypothetical protein